MQLRIQYTDGREQFIPCDPHRTLRFGTRRSADVQLEGGGIFPIHFGVLLHHGAFTAVASEQARKIRVNGARVHEAALHVGDRIEVGEIVFTVVEDEPLPQDRTEASAQPTVREEPSGAGRVWLARVALGCALLPLATLLGVYFGQQPTADELRQTAEDAYREEDYARAVDCYDVYLRKVSRSPESHVARTRRQLADWLSRREGEADAATLLADVQAASIEWNSDDNVSVVGALSQLLPPAVSDLTQQAQVAASSGNTVAAVETLAKAQDGIDLLRRYAAPGRLSAADVAQMQAAVLRIQRPLAAENALAKTLIALEAAAKTGDWNTARAQREALLSAYPQWNRDGRLRDALQQVSGKLAARVETLTPSRNDTTLPATAGAWQARVQLMGSQPATSTGSPPPSSEAGLPPRCMIIPGSGTVLGVDARSGRLLSRSAIGLAGPATVCELGETDCLLAQAICHDVRRVDLTTGELKWRVPLRADALSMSRDGKRCIVLSRPDIISLISADAGAIEWQCRIPQAIDVMPVMDPELPVCYVVADESHVYALSTDSGACLSVCTVGHGQGSVWAPPLAIGEYLLFVEQLGAELSVVHVLRRATEPQAVQDIEIAGRLSGLVQRNGNVVYLPLERGMIGRLLLNSSEQRKPFAAVDLWNVSTKAGRRSTPMQVMCVGDRVCVAEQGLRVFRAPADGNLPVPVAELEPNFVAWGPLRVQGNFLVAVGAPADSHTPQVRAWDLTQSRALWSTTLGVPAARSVSATIEPEALQLVCGLDRYVIPTTRLTSAAGPLQCLEPTATDEAADSRPTSRNAPAAATVDAQVHEGIQGRTIEIAPDGLDCFGPDHELRWRASLSAESIVGFCACGDGELAVADSAGHVWRIGVEQGEMREQLADVGEPLIAGPWWIASHLVVLSRDGCVLVWE